MVLIAQITRELDGVPYDADVDDVFVEDASGSISVQRVEDGTTAIPVSSGLQATQVGVGTWQVDLTSYNLDPVFTYRVYWKIVIGGTPVFAETIVSAVAPGQETRASIRRSIGHLVQGRARFGWGPVLNADSGGVFVNFAKRHPNDHYTAKLLHIVSGAGSYQSTLVSGSIQGSGYLSVTPVWTTQPDASSVVELWGDGITVDDVNEAINRAIMDVAEIQGVPHRVNVPISAINLARDQITLDLPMTKVHSVGYHQPSYGWRWYGPLRATPDEQYLWSVRGRTLYLNYPLPVEADIIAVDGYRAPSRLFTDADICEVNPAYVIYMASFYLEGTEAMGPQLDPEQHSGRAGNWVRQALVLRAEIGTAWAPNTTPLDRA